MNRRPCLRWPTPLTALGFGSLLATPPERWCLCGGWTPSERCHLLTPWMKAQLTRETRQEPVCPGQSPPPVIHVSLLLAITCLLLTVAIKKQKRMRRSSLHRHLQAGLLSPETARRKTLCSGGLSGTQRKCRRISLLWSSWTATDSISGSPTAPCLSQPRSNYGSLINHSARMYRYFT